MEDGLELDLITLTAPQEEKKISISSTMPKAIKE